MICTTAQNYVSITNILPQQELYMNVLSERIITITVLFVLFAERKEISKKFFRNMLNANIRTLEH